MAQFSIKIGETSREMDNENSWIGELSNLEDKVRSAKSNLRWKVAAEAGIRNRLGKALDHTGDCGADMRKLHSALGKVVTQYQGTENRLLGNGDVAETVMPQADGQEQGKEFNWKPLDTTFKFVAKAGVAGAGISTLGKTVKALMNPTDAANWAGAAKDWWGTGWKIGETAKKVKSGTSVGWKDILGLNPSSALKGIAKSSMSAADKAKHAAASAGFKHAIREFKTPGGCAKAVGGLVLSGIANGISNYKEFGKMTGRAWAETVTETAVDWAKGIAIGAAETAGFAAVGVAAPAVVVGAATVAVSVGADWVCKQFTGKSVTEFVSDTILDAGGAAVKSAAKGVKAAWSGLKNGWGNLKSAFGGGGLEPVLA